MILSVSAITKAYGENTVLNGVSFTVEQGVKAAFVGVNGAGKTTLFNIISGALAPDGGSVYIPKGTSVSYLTQSVGYESSLSVYEEMLLAFSDVIEAERSLRELEKRMGAVSGAEYDKLLSEYNKTTHYFEQNDGYGYKSRVRGVIAGLSLDGGMKISDLSGGQKTRAALASALLKKPDILLLDEPTNHLDIDSMSWLENYMKSYPKTVLFISHDRYFIDGVASVVIEIENGAASVYNGGYSFYVRCRRENFEAQEKRHKDEAKALERQRESARLLRSFNREKTIKRAESIEKRISKTEITERPRETGKIHFTLVPKTESGHDVLTVSELTKGYGGPPLFEGVSFDIKKDDKVALIGGNGTGKTTLLKLITGALSPDSGGIRKGTNVRIGYYEQERKRLDMSKTVMQQIRDTYPKLTDGEIRATLAAFLFTGDDVFKPVSALSGGEKGRVCLAEIMLSGANFLILDEPTNDLDMNSKEILENALLHYKGTVLCVSHDRYFINKVADRVLELTQSGLKGYLGNYDYYLSKKEEEAEKAAETEETKTASKEQPQKKGGIDRLERKAEAAAERKRAAAIRRIERLIEETEAKIAEADELLCSPEVFTDHIKAREAHEAKQALENELERLYTQWEEAH